MAGRDRRRIRHRVDAVRGRLEERRRVVASRDSSVWQVPIGEDQIQVVVQPGTESHSYDSATDHPVPLGVRAAADWSWRLLLLAAVVALALAGLWYLRLVTFPLAAAALLAALLGPMVNRLQRSGWTRGWATSVVFLGFLVVLIGSLTFVGRLVGNEFGAVAAKVSTGLLEVQNWVESTFGLSQQQLDRWTGQLSTIIEDNQAAVTEGARSAATLAVELLAGLVLMLFALIFFLYDGNRIWRWLTGLVPQRRRARVDGAGQVAWRTLTSYGRGIVLVATVDAVFISIVLLAVGVPLAIPLGVLVFFGAFVPFVGALVTGFLAVMVALVSNGLVAALIVLAGIIAVQQLEGHVLQPFLLGRMVRVHPLGVVVAVAVGALVAGIIGAVLAVPAVAVLNTVLRYLSATRRPVGEPADGSRAGAQP